MKRTPEQEKAARALSMKKYRLKKLAENPDWEKVKAKAYYAENPEKYAEIRKKKTDYQRKYAKGYAAGNRGKMSAYALAHYHRKKTQPKTP